MPWRMPHIVAKCACSCDLLTTLPYALIHQNCAVLLRYIHWVATGDVVKLFINRIWWLSTPTPLLPTSSSFSTSWFSYLAFSPNSKVLLRSFKADKWRDYFMEMIQMRLLISVPSAQSLYIEVPSNFQYKKFKSATCVDLYSWILEEFTNNLRILVIQWSLVRLNIGH